MIDHFSLRVGDLAKSKKFYDAVLGILGYVIVREEEEKVGYKGPGDASVWLRKENFLTQGAHVAFRAPDRASVDLFYNAGLNVGGKDNGPPGTRPHRGEQYVAFVIDPDGTNIEVVHRP